MGKSRPGLGSDLIAEELCPPGRGEVHDRRPKRRVPFCTARVAKELILPVGDVRVDDAVVTDHCLQGQGNAGEQTARCRCCPVSRRTRTDQIAEIHGAGGEQGKLALRGDGAGPHVCPVGGAHQVLVGVRGDQDDPQVHLRPNFIADPGQQGDEVPGANTPCARGDEDHGWVSAARRLRARLAHVAGDPGNEVGQGQCRPHGRPEPVAAISHTCGRRVVAHGIGLGGGHGGPLGRP